MELFVRQSVYAGFKFLYIVFQRSELKAIGRLLWNFILVKCTVICASGSTVVSADFCVVGEIGVGAEGISLLFFWLQSIVVSHNSSMSPETC